MNLRPLGVREGRDTSQGGREDLEDQGDQEGRDQS